MQRRATGSEFDHVALVVRILPLVSDKVVDAPPASTTFASDPPPPATASSLGSVDVARIALAPLHLLEATGEGCTILPMISRWVVVVILLNIMLTLQFNY